MSPLKPGCTKRPLFWLSLLTFQKKKWEESKQFSSTSPSQSLQCSCQRSGHSLSRSTFGLNPILNAQSCCGANQCCESRGQNRFRSVRKLKSTDEKIYFKIFLVRLTLSFKIHPANVKSLRGTIMQEHMMVIQVFHHEGWTKPLKRKVRDEHQKKGHILEEKWRLASCLQDR